VSETGGHPVERVFAIARMTERMSFLRNERCEVVHDAIPRSRALRGSSPRIWGRRD